MRYGVKGLTKWWMVRAGDNNELLPIWQSKNIISIGWKALGDARKYSSREALIQRANQIYSEEKPGTRIQWASQVWKFSNEITINDRIITYEKDAREYLIGTVTGEYEYNPSIHAYYPNIIQVKWDKKRLSRDILSQGAKNSLGAISTVFRVDDWGSEFETLIEGKVVNLKSDPDDNDPEFNNEDFIQQAKSMVEDAIDRLDPWQMQDLVAGILQAMGYQVRVSPKGPDGGVDILAHKDAFGFEQPIIKVQVKHRNDKSSAPEIQQLLGANPMGGSCIFVATGGFKATAVKVAQQNDVKLLDLTELADLVTNWYESLPSETKALIPMKKIYIPFRIS